MGVVMCLPNASKLNVRVTHWLPIVTRCPLSVWPDFIYITVDFPRFAELYEVRRRLRAIAQGKRMFMEDIAQSVYDAMPTATRVEVRLLTGRHVVTLERIR